MSASRRGEPDGFGGLRVAVIGPLPPPSGGMANQTRQLGELLGAAGAQVQIVQVNAPYRPVWVGRLPVVRSLFRLLPYLWRLWRAAAWADLFHVMANSGWSWHLFAMPAIWIGRLRGTPVVVNYRGGEAGAFLQRSSGLVRASMRRSAALVVPSGFLREVFQPHGMDAEIVPNIVDLARFQPRGPGPSPTPVLLVARNLEPLYDNLTAIRAFQIVRQRMPGVRLVIAGTGPQEAELKAFVETHQLASCVQFAGRLERDAMASQYRASDVVLNPSLADNMPNSVLEAWACGVPVVSTNVGGVPFMARDGVTASLVPPADPQAMAAACLALLSDTALWQARAQAGLQEAGRYTWPSVWPVLRDVYTRALQRTAA